MCRTRRCHCGLEKAGLKADEPIELYADPDARTGRRPDHDLLQTEVQEALLRRARDPEGPNVWILEPPCTSFCDFQKINGGTRSFEEPLGGEGGRRLTGGEELGNQIAAYMATLFIAILDAGKFVMLENQARSGNYPKIWDTPMWKRLLTRSDVELIPWSFCAWDLRPINGSPDQFYRKITLAACAKVNGLRQRLGRRCPGTHVHVPLQGRRIGARISRCQEAGRYPDAFCNGLTDMLKDLLVPLGTTHLDASPDGSAHCRTKTACRHDQRDEFRKTTLVHQVGSNVGASGVSAGLTVSPERTVAEDHEDGKGDCHDGNNEGSSTATGLSDSLRHIMEAQSFEQAET